MRPVNGVGGGYAPLMDGVVPATGAQQAQGNAPQPMRWKFEFEGIKLERYTDSPMSDGEAAHRVEASPPPRALSTWRQENPAPRPVRRATRPPAPQAVAAPAQTPALPPARPEAAQVRPSLWERSPFLRRCLVGAGLLAATVVAAVFGGPLAAIPAASLVFYVVAEWRLAVRRAETTAAVAAAAAAAAQPAEAAAAQPAEAAATTTRGASSAGASPQADSTRPRTNSGVVRNPARPEAQRDQPRSSQRAAGGSAPGVLTRAQEPSPQRIAQAPQIQSPAQPAPVLADASRAATPPASVPRAANPQLRAELRQWAFGGRRPEAEPRLNDSIHTRSPDLDLRGLGLTDLPMVLKKFTWVRRVKVSPKFLRARRKTWPVLPVSALRSWRDAGHGTTADARYLLQCFDERSTHLDLRRRNLTLIPDVVADFPDLQTLYVSVGFMFHGR